MAAKQAVRWTRVRRDPVDAGPEQCLIASGPADTSTSRCERNPTIALVEVRQLEFAELVLRRDANAPRLRACLVMDEVIHMLSC
jgi:hypothetical protein